MPRLEEFRDNLRADKSGGAGDEYAHKRSPKGFDWIDACEGAIVPEPVYW
jgi:hypothetical protein